MTPPERLVAEDAAALPETAPSVDATVFADPAAVGAAPSGPGRSPLRRMLALTGPLRLRLGLAVLAGAAAVGCGVGLMATSGWLIAYCSTHPGPGTLGVSVVAVRAFGIGRGAFRYLERLLSHDVAFRALSDARVAAFERIAVLSPAGLGRYRSGDLLTRLVADVDAIQDLYVRGVAPPLTALVVGTAASLGIGLLLAPAGLVLAAGLLLAGLALPLLTAALTRPDASRLVAARARLAADVVDVVNGAADLVAYGAERRALARAMAADAELAAVARRQARMSGLGVGLGVLLSGMTLWLALATATAAVADRRLDRMGLAVVVFTVLAAFEAVAPLPAAAAALAGSSESARRLFGVLDGPDPVREPDPSVPAPDGALSVAVRDAVLSYEPDQPPALAGLDLDLPAGQRVAVVGPSGSGKSTVVTVLVRFRDLDAGQATLSGRPLPSLRSEDVRSRVSGVLQDPHVFDTTVRDNLRLARPDADDARLDAAARTARLDGWIAGLPRGYDTAVGVHGSALSGGERQRLALARALLADPAVLVLDEPTAHLDQRARQDIAADVLAVTAGRTTLLVTHDLDGLAAVDHVLVVEGGRVVQAGRHEDLVAVEGPYRRAWDSQHDLP